MAERVCALFTIMLLVVGVGLERKPLLEGFGITEYYLGRQNSCCEVYSVIENAEKEFKRLLNVKGERAGGLEKEKVDEVLNFFGAEFVFSEGVENVVCEYYYSDKIAAYNFINGKKVNLHIVFDGYVYSVGTPMIFGGY